jgi:quinol-cytochrome oxidoreductase complex cytochrome b subunit
VADGESKGERLDRELIELLNELRVLLPGVQVLLAFLLTAPFNQRFAELGPAVQEAYFGAVLCAAAATLLLVAPGVHHRVQWRDRDKERLLRTANRLTLVGTVFLAVAIVLALWVVSRVIHASGTAFLVAAGALVAFAWFWYALPLLRRLRLSPGEAEPAEERDTAAADRTR